MKLKQRIYRLFLNLRQRTYRLFCLIIMCLSALLGLNSPAVAGRIYVDGSLQACGDGISWGTAFRYLQDALAIANGQNDDQIWVRAGTYYVDQDCANPDGSGDRTETYQLVRRTWLLGGFNGTEIDASERNSVLNITILSGAIAQGQDPPGCALTELSCFEAPHDPECLFDIDRECCWRVCFGENGDPYCCLVEWDEQCVTLALEECGGSYHVVTAGSEIDDPEQTVIDGFTIRDGTANGTLNDQHHGGGMLIQGEPSVVRCTFTSNTARGRGGLPSVEGRGGGMSINGDFKRPWIINTIFEDNPGDQDLIPINGGGLASSQADPILTNCLFVGNFAEQNGGGLYNLVGSCPPGEGCGRITLINCTVYGNTADMVGTGFTGGGLYFNGTAGRLDAENTIVWGNNPGNNQIDGVGPTVFDINYSDCQGVCPPGIGGIGNKNVDPEFVFAPVNLRLSLGSPVIDMGNDDEAVIPCDFFNLDNDGFDCTFMADEPTPDLDLINRVLDGDNNGTVLVDMGAYEFIHPGSCPWDLDGDGMVGAKDLMILLDAWGLCDDCGDCPADFDGDCDVNVPDLLALLGNWGACPAFSVEPPSLADALAAACVTQENWGDFLDIIETGSKAEKENWLCWMNHHLNVCTNCICPHFPGICPGPDPF